MTACRVWIVTGKGGVGKTTLAATLAAVGARRGLRALVVSAGGDGALPALLDVDIERCRGREPAMLSERLGILEIEPEAALEEYVEHEIGWGRVGRSLLRSRAFSRFLDAAPGWRDLVTLGKIWHMEQQREGGRPRYDVIVVDAPATGHGLSFLSVPRVVLDVVTVGPLRRQTAAIEAMLLDSRRTWCIPVTLAEELPVRETLELIDRLAERGIRTGPLVANQIEPALDLEVAPSLAALEKLSPDGAPPLASPEALAAAVRHYAARQALQEHWLAHLAERAGEIALHVPHALGAAVGPALVEQLADAIDVELAASGAWDT
jgi:anion-transporting  ArsA/GET3 family ATPase